MRPPARAVAPLLLLLIATAACVGDDDVERRAEAYAEAALERGAAASGTVPRDTAAPAIMIASTDTLMELGVVRDRVVLRLSAPALAKARAELARVERGADSAGGALGATIANAVKRSTSAALDRQYEWPVAEITDARYEDGAIVLEHRGEPVKPLTQVKVNGRALARTFAPGDARRFVAAVNVARGKN